VPHRRPRSNALSRICATFAALALLTAAASLGANPDNGATDALSILHEVRETIEKNYFDPKLNGFDINSEFQAAETEIKSNTALGASIITIGRTVEKMHDSHTRFFPPSNHVALTPGWRSFMVGDSCFIFAVEPGSDAASQGIKPGDQVLKINGFEPKRPTYASLTYLLHTLAPQPNFHLELASPGEASREVDPKSRAEAFKNLPQDNGMDVHQADRFYEGVWHLAKPRSAELSADVLVWKLPVFYQSRDETDHIFGAAQKYKTLIVDLRENGGGGEEQMKWVIANLIQHDQVVGNFVERQGTKEFKVTTRGQNGFAGKLIVLVDSASASASEVVSRTLQLEKRGTVIGDRTAGAVGRGKIFPLTTNGYHYAMHITIARLRFPDGADLDGVGVTPDVLMLPTASDLAAGRDPVLAAAAKLAGVDITPEAAGKLFPIVWPTY
jgi:carboxyl-terminal processing protease